MTTQVRPLSRSAGSVPAGTITLLLGILFTAAVAYTYALSLSDTFNPPNWVRVIGLVWWPSSPWSSPSADATPDARSLMTSTRWMGRGLLLVDSLSSDAGRRSDNDVRTRPWP